MATQPPIPIVLADWEVALLIDALDSHEYWQLSESHERNDGYSTIEAGENEEIDATRELTAKLDRYRASARR